MKFRVERRVFAEIVASVSEVIPAKPEAPILYGIHLSATEDQLTLRGFDFETAITASCEGDGEEGEALVPGKLLAQLAKLLAAEIVELEVDGNYLRMRAGNTTYELPTMLLDDYPGLPNPTEPLFEVESDVFADAVGRVAPAVAPTPKKLPILMGIRLTFNNRARVTLKATDTYRLAMIDIDLPSAQALASVSVPGKFMRLAAKRLNGTLKIGFNDTLFSVASPTGTMTTRLLEGSYPAVPKFGDQTVVAKVSAKELLAAIKRMAPLFDGSTPMDLLFRDDGTLTTQVNGEMGSGESRAHETLSADIVENYTISCSPNFLADGLKSVGDTAEFHFNSNPLKPFRVVGDGFTYLMMPIRKPD